MTSKTLMTAHTKTNSAKLQSGMSKPGAAALDAKHWRRFLTNAPPLEDLIEIRRLHDNKTIIRRLAELPPSFSPSRAEWRPL